MSTVLGATQIFIGISCIGLQIGAFIHYSPAWSAVFMQGIWCGVFVSILKHHDLVYIFYKTNVYGENIKVKDFRHI